MAPTKNFPPKPTFTGSDGEEGSNGCWVTACGIDDLHADGAGVTKVSLYVMTASTKKVEDISVRYYFSTKGMSDPNHVQVSELYDQAAVEAAPANGTISGPYKYDKMDDVYYVEIKWSDYNIANSGKKYQFTVGLYYGDKWQPADDWSYQNLKIYEQDDAFFATGTEVRNDNICVYSGDKLVGGVEPDGTVPDFGTDTDKTAVNYGDADCDGAVTMNDAVLMSQYITSPKKYPLTEAGLKNADCVEDGAITSADVKAVQMLLAGIYTQSDLPAKK